jgi:putative endonuclease
MKFYWVYILLCENNCYYTGYTIDLDARYEAHLNGTASKYTRSFRPLKIAQSWKIPGDKSLAMKIEKRIKKLSRTEKEKIIRDPLTLFTSFDG